jgi:hypothetical protein
MKETLQRREHDIRRDQPNAVEDGYEHQDSTRQEEASAHDQQPGRVFIAPTLPMPYRYTYDQLDREQRDKVVDQSAGLSADQLKGVSQEWHDHLRKLERDTIIPQPEKKKKIETLRLE